MMIRGLIFDFDGLILDTELPSFQSWQEIYQAHGCHLPLSLYAACIGTWEEAFDPHEYLEAQLGRSFDRETIREQRRQRCLELINAQPPLPGVQGYIADAKRLGVRLGVASSSPRNWVVGHLTRLGLIDHFDSLRCGDEVTAAKPDPELYRAVLSLLDLRPSETIALEDSPNGILAAKAAGIFCVAVPNPLTRQLSLDHADLQLSSLADVSFEELVQKTRKLMKFDDHNR